MFTTYKSSVFTFNPTSSDVGAYEVSIVLQEVKNSKSKNSYTLKVEVMPDKN